MYSKWRVNRRNEKMFSFQVTFLSNQTNEIDNILHKPNLHYLSVYPNPVQKSFQIKTNLLDSQLVIYNIKGQKILQQHIFDEAKHINLPENTPNGVYFARIHKDNNVIYKKLVIFNTIPRLK